MKGRYRKGRPYVAGTVLLPRLNVSGDIMFLLDTGCDFSLISPTDAKRIGCYQEGVPFENVIGWDGPMSVGIEQAMVGFNDIAIKLYSINIGIVACEPRQRYTMPSVIGRDLMSRWRIVWEPRTAVLEIEHKHPDWDETGTTVIADAIRAHAESEGSNGLINV